MAMLTMPIIVANLGCEMLYILDQRLRAHDVHSTKAAQVLDDIAACMFESEFVNTLFMPHEMYSVRSTHLILSKLAHSSIMRLSTSSMEKLFDLILMGVKMQLLVSATADAMLEITQRHISTARGLLAGASGPLLDAFVRRLGAAYDQLTPGQWLMWRAKMSSFFLDRRIKVSLFLQEGIQAKNGHFYLRPPAQSLRLGAAKVGTVKKLNADGSVASTKEVHLACHDEDLNEYFCHPTALGDNLYSHARLKVLPPPRRTVSMRQRAPNLATAPSISDAVLAGNERTLQTQPTLRGPSDLDALEHDAASRHEHDLLRQMFGTRPAAKAEFKLSLFDEGDSGALCSDPSEHVLDLSAKVKVIKLEGSNAQYAGKLAASLETAGAEQAAAEDDLLALMDEAVVA